MTKYEWLRLITFPIMTAHLRTVHRDISRLISESKADKNQLKILDVGGRKSPYTIGVDADVTLLDIPQETKIQESLDLGFTENILSTIKEKRSNIEDLIIADMSKSSLEVDKYDAVLAIEVIEHVEADEQFVKNISQVVKKGGWVYITTPNGDYIKNEGPDKNPDHIRHYTRNELRLLLQRYFNVVDVYYAIRTGKHRVNGLRSYSLKRPIKTFKSIYSNVINYRQSRGVKQMSQNTAHLVAVAYK